MKNVRVGIDNRFYSSSVISGRSRVIKIFKKGLARVKSPFKFYFFSTTTPGNGEKRWSITDLIRWDQFLLPDMLCKKQIRIFHSFALPIPCCNVPCRLVLSCHDVIPWLGHDGDTFPDLFNKYFVEWMQKSYAHADSIIADSHHAKNDLCRVCGIPANKVKVVYYPIDTVFRPLACMAKMKSAIKHKLGIDGSYILNVNVLTRRKNVETLIAAYLRLKKKRGIRHKLVIAGSTVFHKPKATRNKDIIFTGAVEENLLVYLYNCADMFVFPSLYEGFGFPPLEAMACGIPVIVSSGGSLPEIAGPGACVFEPKDSVYLASCMLRITEDEKFRHQLIQRGRERVKIFSPERFVQEVLSIYESLI